MGHEAAKNINFAVQPDINDALCAAGWRSGKKCLLGIGLLENVLKSKGSWNARFRAVGSIITSVLSWSDHLGLTYTYSV